MSGIAIGIAISAADTRSANAQAAIQQNGQGSTFAGLDLGAAAVGNGSGLLLDYGAVFGYFFRPELFAGAFINYSNLGSVTSPLGNASSGLTVFGVEGDLALPQVLPGLYVGLKLGLQIISSTFNGTSTNSNSFVLGPQVGWDIPFATSFSIGPQANYLIAFVNNNPNELNLLAVIKYWF